MVGSVVATVEDDLDDDDDFDYDVDDFDKADIIASPFTVIQYGATRGPTGNESARFSFHYAYADAASEALALRECGADVSVIDRRVALTPRPDAYSTILAALRREAKEGEISRKRRNAEPNTANPPAPDPDPPTRASGTGGLGRGTR